MVCDISGAQVQAIRVDAASSQEALAQEELQHHHRQQLDEEVFIAQLCLRSRLLDAPFRESVMRVLRRHAAAGAQPSICMQKKASTTGNSYLSMDTDVSGSLGEGPRLAPSMVLNCTFNEGSGPVELHAAPVKTAARMREKLCDYGVPGSSGVWPFAASILDPVRVSVVCEGPSQILQVLSWFNDSFEETGLPICRIKNGFADEGNGAAGGNSGYRDLKLFVLMTGPGSLRIIGEIQV
jgi:hypothetical protein